MSDLLNRAEELDLVLETEFDTQRSIEQNPYGATKAIEDALLLIRDLVDEIKRLEKQCDGLFEAATNNGQDVILLESKLKEIKEQMTDRLYGDERYTDHGRIED